jgi:hypothetical protein
MCRCLLLSCPSADALNQRARRKDFDSCGVSVMAILQPPYFRNYTVRRLLPRKWRLVLFAMTFLSLPSHPSAAEPIKRNFVMCRPELSLPNGFLPRSVLFPPSPATIFHWDAVDLTHIIVPPEFRTHDSKAANARAERPQAPRWYPPAPPPCPPGWFPSSI